MNITSDYHTHTYLCKHADGEPLDYLKKAYESGLSIMGISDHCPSPNGFDIDCRMDRKQLDEYVSLISELKNNSYGIKVLFGWEIDWVPGRMDEVLNFTNKTNYDYLICSTHYLDNYPIDNSRYQGFWKSDEKIQEVWDKYAENLYAMVEFGEFDIIGHIDLPKKYNKYPRNLDYFNYRLEQTLKIAAQKNIIMEINTAGLRKKVNEIYPSPDILKIACKNNVKITFGSDAHSPNEVAYEFKRAKELAKEAGYNTYVQLVENGYRKESKL